MQAVREWSFVSSEEIFFRDTRCYSVSKRRTGQCHAREVVKAKRTVRYTHCNHSTVAEDQIGNIDF